MHQRGVHGIWKNRWTFILAATGSAVGLGNIWKFPYIAGENGGGAFVLVYLLCIALIGIPVMLAEVLIGRRGRLSPINTMRFVTREAGVHPAWTSIGWMGVLAGLFIMSFYSVVAGWALSYIQTSATGTFTGASAAAVAGHLSELHANPAAIIMWHTIFSLLTACVVALGVANGLGAVARYMMPVLFLTLLLLVGYSFVYGDFAAGFHFLFDLSFDKLTWNGVLIALGHAFFTLSLGMGAIMAYGAYMPEGASIGKSIITVAMLDTLVALAAGLAIFPIVFAHPALEAGSGPSLMFVTIPIAFGGMPLGELFGTVFFILVSLAAWSSAVSLIEPGVAWFIESKGLSRFTATALLSGMAWLLGISSALSFNLLEDYRPPYLLNQNPFDFFDVITSRIMLPLGGFFIAVFVGWYMHKQVVQQEMRGEDHPLFEIWYFVLRYFSPVLIAVVMIISLVQQFRGP